MWFELGIYQVFPIFGQGADPVSYTHLDVYKRQVEARIEGKVSVHCPDGILKIGDKAKICGWHNTEMCIRDRAKPMNFPNEVYCSILIDPRDLGNVIDGKNSIDPRELTVLSLIHI